MMDGNEVLEKMLDPADRTAESYDIEDKNCNTEQNEELIYLCKDWDQLQEKYEFVCERP